MVPIKELTDVLKVVKETANLKPKMWVRLKRGIFKDDLAQVEIRSKVPEVNFPWFVSVAVQEKVCPFLCCSRWTMLNQLRTKCEWKCCRESTTQEREEWCGDLHRWAAERVNVVGCFVHIYFRFINACCNCTNQSLQPAWIVNSGAKEKTSRIICNVWAVEWSYIEQGCVCSGDQALVLVDGHIHRWLLDQSFSMKVSHWKVSSGTLASYGIHVVLCPLFTFIQ